FDVIEKARATDATHVELSLACPVSDLSHDTVTIEDVTRSTEALTVLGITGARKVTVETTPQVGLRTYTVRIDGGHGPDGAVVNASANFVGVGDITTAPVTLQVDDRYNASLDAV